MPLKVLSEQLSAISFNFIMCLLAWRWSPDQLQSLTLISNRDEFYDRPTQNSEQWPGTFIWGGKDLRAGGTWLGVTGSGRLAAVTNHRSPDLTRDMEASRGSLVLQFLDSEISSSAFVERLADRCDAYNPFNLLVYDGDVLMGFEGRVDSCRVVTLKPGYGGVSNADFNTPWAKQVRLQTGFEQLIENNSSDEALLDLLLNEEVAPMHQLPQTGISIDKEIALSAVFIRMENYGTRASSLVRMGHDAIVLTERVFNHQAKTHQIRHVISKDWM